MKKSLAIASTVACLAIGTLVLHASEQFGLENAGSVAQILEEPSGKDNIATPEARPVDRLSHDHHDRDHGHDDGEALYVECASDDYNRRECYVGTDRPIDYVEVYSQYSRAACTRGTTWGFDGHSIWVSNGCRARFVVRTFNGRRVEKQILCESRDYNRSTCWTGLRSIRDAYANQISRAACTRGTTWGVDGTNVWVSNGCRAQITVVGYERW